MSEVGDKTFFIAALLSMRHGPGLVFAGALSALAGMTVLSVAVGAALPRLLSPKITHWAATGLFFLFGIKLLYESYTTDEGNDNELESVEESLKQPDRASWYIPSCLIRLKDAINPVFLQALMLTFLAEWGDRSQLATIALGAIKNAIGVTLGGCVGHACCTGVACLGGKVLAQRISEKMINICGGILFLLFGFVGLLFPDWRR